MLHDAVRYEARFKCLTDDVSLKRPMLCRPNFLPLRPNDLSPKRPVAQMFFAKTSCRLNDWWPLTRSKSVAVLGARRTRYLHTAVLLAQKQLPPVWLPSLLVWVGSDPQNKCIIGRSVQHVQEKRHSPSTLSDMRLQVYVRTSLSKTSTPLCVSL